MQMNRSPLESDGPSEPMYGEAIQNLSLAELHAQMGELYTRLESASEQLTKFEFQLFSDSESNVFPQLQDQIIQFQQQWFQAGELALNSTNPGFIRAAYESLVHSGRKILAAVSVYTLRIGDYQDAMSVLSDFDRFERTHLRDMEKCPDYSQNIQQYRSTFLALMMEVLRDDPSGRTFAFRELAKGGRSLLAFLSAELESVAQDPDYFPRPVSNSAFAAWATTNYMAISFEEDIVGQTQEHPMGADQLASEDETPFETQEWDGFWGASEDRSLDFVDTEGFLPIPATASTELESLAVALPPEESLSDESIPAANFPGEDDLADVLVPTEEFDTMEPLADESASTIESRLEHLFDENEPTVSDVPVMKDSQPFFEDENDLLAEPSPPQPEPADIAAQANAIPPPRSEVQLTLDRHRLTAKLETANQKLEDSQAKEAVFETGSRVRKWVRDLFGRTKKHQQDHLEARKQVVEDLKVVNEAKAQLREIDNELLAIRERANAHRTPEVRLEPKRNQLTKVIYAIETELRTLKRRVDGTKKADERAYWAGLFNEKQKQYGANLAELADVETEMYGRPIDRITSKLKDVVIPIAPQLKTETQPLTLAGVALPGVPAFPTVVPQARAAAANQKPKRPASKLSPKSGGVLLSPNVPQWEETHRKPLRERIEESFLLRTAMSSLPPEGVPREVIGEKTKVGADKPDVQFKQAVAPKNRVLAEADARCTLRQIKRSRLSQLRKEDPFRHDSVVAGINSARRHTQLEPLDPNEWDQLQESKDVLPARIVKIEDEIAVLEAEPKGLFARAKRALSRSHKREQRLDELKAQLQAFEQEEIAVHERLQEIARQEAA